LQITGVSTLVNLTANQQALLTAAITASLRRPTLNATVGTPTALRRRLLDLSLPVTVEGHGDNSTLASESSAVFTRAVDLSLFAAALGAASATATVPVMTAAVTITVRAATMAAAASISASLASPAGVQSALAAANVSATVTVTTQPAVVQAPPAPFAPPAPVAPPAGELVVTAASGASTRSATLLVAVLLATGVAALL
jgi:hypothetical protein